MQHSSMGQHHHVLLIYTSLNEVGYLLRLCLCMYIKKFYYKPYAGMLCCTQKALDEYTSYYVQT